MAKLMTKQGNQSDLKTKMTGWLEGQGYPLEMQVAQSFQSKYFTTLQSYFYTDPESKNIRETDVIAYRDIAAINMVVRLSIVVECKNAKDKPWVLFSSGQDHLPEQTRVIQHASSLAGAKALQLLMKYPSIQDSPLFRTGKNSGYSLIQAFGAENNSDLAYKSLMSVSTATNSMALFSDYYNMDENKVTHANPQLAHILFPVVVIGGSLWKCCMNKKSSALDIAQINSGTLIWKNPLLRHPHTIVHIVTEAYLDSFVNDVNKTLSDIQTLVEGHAKGDFSAIPEIYKPRPRRTSHIGI